jgi:predicted NBD/HSP70 family sugar kinase
VVTAAAVASAVVLVVLEQQRIHHGDLQPQQGKTFQERFTTQAVLVEIQILQRARQGLAAAVQAVRVAAQAVRVLLTRAAAAVQPLQVVRES